MGLAHHRLAYSGTTYVLCIRTGMAYKKLGWKVQNDDENNKIKRVGLNRTESSLASVHA